MSNFKLQKHQVANRQTVSKTFVEAPAALVDFVFGYLGR